MRWITETWRRLLALGRRADVEHRLSDELLFHVEQQTAKNVRAGMPLDAARRQALVQFGAVERAKEATRDEFRAARIEDVARDVRYAVRTLSRTPGFASVAILTLGIGIGASTAVYSTADWLLYRPPGGVVEPDRLVSLGTTDGQRNLTFAFTQYEAIRDVQAVFSDLAAYAKIPGVASTDTRTDQVVFEFVTGNYFSMLGLRPELGRVIGPHDDVAGGMTGVVLSHAFWQSRFGGDPAAVGSTMTLNGQRCVVIGILPREFEGYGLSWNGPSSVWLPMQSYPSFHLQSNMLTRVGQGGIFFRLIGRLQSGVSLDMAQESAHAWVPLLTTAPGDNFTPSGITVEPSSETRLSRSARGATLELFRVLTGVCALVLLAACFNVANFLIGRSVSRRREIAVRAAIGATCWRIARQLFIEALVIGLSAATVGIAVAVALIRMSAAMPDIFFGVPVTIEAVVDGRVAVVAVALGLLSAILFGLIPAAVASVRNPIADLKDPKPGWSWSGVRVSTRQLLMVLQVAVAVVLVSTAGLYIHSLAKIAAIDSGYDAAEKVLVARIDPRGLPAEQVGQFYRQLFAGLDTMQGVVSASIAWNRPYVITVNFFSLPGSDAPPVEAGQGIAGPRLFQTLGIGLVAGREFDDMEHDLQNGIVVNTLLADRLWPGQSAVGERVRAMHGQEERTVIGVTTEERCRSILSPPEPCAYQPFQASTGLAYMRVRVDGDPMAFAPRLRAFIHDLDPAVALSEEKPLHLHVRDLTAAQRMSAMATLFVAVLGIFMLAAGCVSLFVSMVRDSSREIAIRMALGATNGRLVRRVLFQGIALTVAGMVAGLIAARAVAMRIADQLHDVSAGDPLTWLTAPSLIAVVSLLGVYAAANLAARADPKTLLQSD